MSPQDEAHEAAVHALVQQLLTQLLYYRPDQPLEFIVDHLDEVCDGENPLAHSLRALRLTHRTPERFVEALSDAYSSLASRRNASFVGADDVIRFISLMSSDLPKTAETPLLEAIEETCNNRSEPVEFERFSACVGAVVSVLELHGEARDLVAAIDATPDDCPLDALLAAAAPPGREADASRSKRRSSRSAVPEPRRPSRQARTLHDLLTSMSSTGVPARQTSLDAVLNVAVQRAVDDVHACKNALTNAGFDSVMEYDSFARIRAGAPQDS
ncbi:hypothetical protein M885DRAFT_547023 [Pelagophyceae sp. CCMP2097]|nr:hypothetical protein M885DRAFT_547023 [Pelagophyceae sp. CCMP2097]|mmetsp:Transcript_22700/g.76692  ORF Transcript_22700/g.76692 Transcript_22700/m.76692 type:complete len:271 (-) Transcript_22700:14-826(-)